MPVLFNTFTIVYNNAEYLNRQKYKHYASACAFSVTNLLTMFPVLIAVCCDDYPNKLFLIIIINSQTDQRVKLKIKATHQTKKAHVAVARAETSDLSFCML